MFKVIAGNWVIYWHTKLSVSVLQLIKRSGVLFVCVHSEGTQEQSGVGGHDEHAMPP